MGKKLDCHSFYCMTCGYFPIYVYIAWFVMQVIAFVIEGSSWRCYGQDYFDCNFAVVYIGFPIKFFSILEFRIISKY